MFEGKSIELITIPSTVVKIQPQYCDAKIKLEDGNATYEVINNCLIEKATKKLISGGKYSIIPEGVKEIGDGAFAGTSIEEITMPNTVNKIGMVAFDDCKKLKTVTLNEGLNEIGYSAFGYSSIESITIPGTVNDTGIHAFSCCKNLKKVTLNEGVKSIGNSGFLETSIEEIVIPSTVEKIEALAFHGCINLKKVTLNEGLKEIEDLVFVCKQIETITIPSTVKKIGRVPFFLCNNLPRIDCKLKKSYVEANKSSFEVLDERGRPRINWING